MRRTPKGAEAAEEKEREKEKALQKREVKH